MEFTTAEEWCQDQVWKKYFKGKIFKTKSLTIPATVLEYLVHDEVVVDKNDSDDEIQRFLHSDEYSNFSRAIEEAIEEIGGKEK